MFPKSLVAKASFGFLRITNWRSCFCRRCSQGSDFSCQEVGKDKESKFHCTWQCFVRSTLWQEIGAESVAWRCPIYLFASTNGFSFYLQRPFRLKWINQFVSLIECNLHTYLQSKHLSVCSVSIMSCPSPSQIRLKVTVTKFKHWNPVWKHTAEYRVLQLRSISDDLLGTPHVDAMQCLTVWTSELSLMDCAITADFSTPWPSS